MEEAQDCSSWHPIGERPMPSGGLVLADDYGVAYLTNVT